MKAWNLIKKSFIVRKNRGKFKFNSLSGVGVLGGLVEGEFDRLRVELVALAALIG